LQKWFPKGEARLNEENGQIPKSFYESTVPLSDRIEQPRPGESPVPPGGAFADAERLGGFFDAQADEVTQLDHLGLLGVHGGEPLQSVVDGEDTLIGVRGRDFDPIEIRALLPAAVARGELAPGGIDEQAAHGFRGDGEEMGVVLELSLAIGVHQTQPGFVHQRRRLQGVPGPFTRHLRRSEPPQFFIDKTQKLTTGV
jgi:hypothetical protein